MGLDWSAWEWDWPTALWILWALYFVALETYGVWFDVRGTLTWHLRPVFHAAPVTWYIGIAVWLWLGPHFFFPSLEVQLARLVGQ